MTPIPVIATLSIIAPNVKVFRFDRQPVIPNVPAILGYRQIRVKGEGFEGFTASPNSRPEPPTDLPT
jgi:hypothetical protein